MLANSPPQVDRTHLRAIVYVLVAIFGLGTWTNLSGLFIELPLIVPVLPESWQLPAKLVLIIDSANVVPISIVFASLIFQLNTASFEVPVNFIILVCSICFAFAFAFFWNNTAYLFGIEQSVCLMVLCFCSAITDCLSSSTFIPFLYRYEPMYLNAYFVGEAFTALLPALLGFVQGIGTSDCNSSMNGTTTAVRDQTAFSVRTYFLLISALPLAALLSFTMLRFMETGRLKSKQPLPPLRKSKHHQSRVFILMENLNDLDFVQTTLRTIDKIENQLKRTPRVQSFLFSRPGFYLFIVFQCSAMLYGAAQGLTTFSLNAYSSTTFHYTIIVSQFAYPLVSLIGTFIPEVSSKVIYFLYASSTAFFIYIFNTARLSPCPPLVNQISGHVIIFFVWIFINLTCSCIRISMGNYFRKQLGHHGLICFGVATQLGGLVGAIITFLVTNTFQLFQERNPCDQTLRCS